MNNRTLSHIKDFISYPTLRPSLHWALHSSGTRDITQRAWYSLAVSNAKAEKEKGVP